MPLTLAQKFHNASSIDKDAARTLYLPHITHTFSSPTHSIVIFHDDSSSLCNLTTKKYTYFPSLPSFLKAITTDPWTEAAAESLMVTNPSFKIAILQATLTEALTCRTRTIAADFPTTFIDTLITSIKQSLKEAQKKAPKEKESRND